MRTIENRGHALIRCRELSKWISARHMSKYTNFAARLAMSNERKMCNFGRAVWRHRNHHAERVLRADLEQ